MVRSGKGYEISKTSNLGIGTLFCDFYEHNLRDNSSWVRLSREVSRSRNVFAYMIGHAFLIGIQPSKDRVGDQWTTWHSQLKAIGRSISAVTMAALLDEELKYFGEKST